MANSHPYISGPGNIEKIVEHLREKKFPPTIDLDTIKKLGIAPKNETYLINILKFIKVIDADGKGTERGINVFTTSDDANFHKKFSDLVREAYSGLFNIHGEKTWTLDNDLISFFARTIK